MISHQAVTAISSMRCTWSCLAERLLSSLYLWYYLQASTDLCPSRSKSVAFLLTFGYEVEHLLMAKLCEDLA